MGRLYYITCKNEQCQYHVELREGVGWAELIDLGKLEEEVRSGEIDNAAAQKGLENGAIMKANAIYLCPQCKEFQSNRISYLEKITEPYFEEFHHEISFPFGKPRCEKCNNELIYINELDCSKETKCPKCGEELNVELGLFD